MGLQSLLFGPFKPFQLSSITDDLDVKHKRNLNKTTCIIQRCFCQTTKNSQLKALKTYIQYTPLSVKICFLLWKFQLQTWSGEIMFSILSPSETILRAIIENMISPEYVLCYVPRATAILSWKWKFWNLLVRRRRPLWCNWRPLCGFGNFGEKI